MDLKYLKVTIENHVAQVSFNRPEKANSLHMPAWYEMKFVFDELDENPEVRVIVLTGEGKHFCAGIDLETLMDLQKYNSIDNKIYTLIKNRGCYTSHNNSISIFF